jgi:hypothetical protein
MFESSFENMESNTMFFMLIGILAPIFTSMLTNGIKNTIDLIGKFINNVFVFISDKRYYTTEIIDEYTVSDKNGTYQIRQNKKLIDAIVLSLKNSDYCKQECDYDYSNNILLFKPNNTIKLDDMLLTHSYDISITDKHKRVKEKYIIKSKKKGRVEIFLNKAILNYENNLDKNMYYFITGRGNPMHGDNLNLYDFKLDLKTTFDDLLFPEKQVIIDALDLLPKKINMLLYGLPGCGKTSVIKAISNYTKRHIVNIRLSQIKNDMELYKLLFSDEIQFLNGLVRNIPMNQKMFVFEDIDAESQVVLQRKYQQIEKKKDDDNNSDYDVDDQDYHRRKKIIKKTDLTLSGILNVFDGCMELYDSIVIFTTNYIEKLDTALVRPGRITLNIEMKKLLFANAVLMIQDKFPKLDPKQIAELGDYSITPAELEGYLNVSNDLDSLLKLLI